MLGTCRFCRKLQIGVVFWNRHPGLLWEVTNCCAEHLQKMTADACRVGVECIFRLLTPRPLTRGLPDLAAYLPDASRSD